MHALLKDLHGKRRDNDKVKVWVAQIREEAYDAEDIIDSYIFNIEKQGRETSDGFMGSIRSFACCIKDIPTIHKIGKEIGDIEIRLNEISSNRSYYGIDNIPGCGEASSSSNQSQMSREKGIPIAKEADVVGVEDETKTQVGRLIEGDARRAVISITAITTLTCLTEQDAHPIIATDETPSSITIPP
ncbi:putative disease resistance protein At1g50180 [Magnolia sinica]|uniref:putative disease resistance protein At1g50180 n=1 Tax=Magnolia sinica TaxID=86752 RepID=UPI002658CF8D|nr:putative disease resistance protein At1g50180 [Magnolia sinica]